MLMLLLLPLYSWFIVHSRIPTSDFLYRKGIIRLWDFLIGRRVDEFQAYNDEAVRSMLVHSAGRRLITGIRDRIVCKIDS